MVPVGETLLIPRLLIVDDDPGYSDFLGQALAGLTDARRVVAGLHAAGRAFDDFKPDLVLLDAVLPDGNGIDLCRRWRVQERPGRSALIAVLTGNTEVLDEEEWLSAGADACWQKTRCETRILSLAKGLWRRHVNDSGGISWRGGGIIFEPATRRFFCAGRWSKPLTPREILLFGDLRAASPDSVPRERLTREYVKDVPSGNGALALNVLIARLRKKLPAKAATAIETVEGVGYRFNEDRLR